MCNKIISLSILLSILNWPSILSVPWYALNHRNFPTPPPPDVSDMTYILPCNPGLSIFFVRGGRGARLIITLIVSLKACLLLSTHQSWRINSLWQFTFVRLPCRHCHAFFLSLQQMVNVVLIRISKNRTAVIRSYCTKTTCCLLLPPRMVRVEIGWNLETTWSVLTQYWQKQTNKQTSKQQQKQQISQALKPSKGVMWLWFFSQINTNIV